MAYKTYKVRDIVSHRSYPVRKCDIARMQFTFAGTALILKKPIRKIGRTNWLAVSDRTLDRLGLAIRG